MLPAGPRPAVLPAVADLPVAVSPLLHLAVAVAALLLLCLCQEAVAAWAVPLRCLERPAGALEAKN